MREVIQCLIDWLEESPSDEKPHRILRVLAKESLKVVNSDDETRRFTATDIVEALEENPSDSNSKWINWNNSVLRYWDKRKSQVIELARKQGLEYYPEPECISTKGGRGNETSYYIKSVPLPDSNDEQLVIGFQPSIKNSGAIIDYTLECGGKVKPMLFLKWLFINGNLRLRKWHRWIILGWIIFIGGGGLAFSWFGFEIMSTPIPVTTREINLYIFLFIIPCIAWLWVKPWTKFIEDRIIISPDMIYDFREKSAQLEYYQDGDLRIIRLVRYFATCPICGATIYLEEGEPDFPRRLVGRCNESPREHVFSFDRVTRKGVVLRCPA